jgi:hypothetical protein
MGLRPIEPLFHIPQINDVADEIEIFTVCSMEKIKQIFSARAWKTQVNIGDPNGPVGPARIQQMNVFHRSILRLSSFNKWPDTMPSDCFRDMKV